jgi:hypothetical protein
MPRIPGCTAALSKLILTNNAKGKRDFDDTVPRPYRITPERWASDVNLIKGAMGQNPSAWVKEEIRAKL